MSLHWRHILMRSSPQLRGGRLHLCLRTSSGWHTLLSRSSTRRHVAAPSLHAGDAPARSRPVSGNCLYRQRLLGKSHSAANQPAPAPRQSDLCSYGPCRKTSDWPQYHSNGAQQWYATKPAGCDCCGCDLEWAFRVALSSCTARCDIVKRKDNGCVPRRPVASSHARGSRKQDFMTLATKCALARHVVVRALERLGTDLWRN
jgi:hypothetical protein